MIALYVVLGVLLYFFLASTLLGLFARLTGENVAEDRLIFVVLWPISVPILFLMLWYKVVSGSKK